MSFKKAKRWNVVFLIIFILLILVTWSMDVWADDPEPTATIMWTERDGENPHICLSVVHLLGIGAGIGVGKYLTLLFRKRERKVSGVLNETNY